jgi:hypothetical protein
MAIFMRGKRPWCATGAVAAACRKARRRCGNARERAAPEQQRKQHRAAIGQIHFNVEAPAADEDFAGDEPAFLAVAAGVGDDAAIEHRRRARDHARRAAPRAHAEAHVQATVEIEGFEIFHAQRRTARAAVELGLDRRDAELRQRYPFAPAEHARFHDRGRDATKFFAGHECAGLCD